MSKRRLQIGEFLDGRFSVNQFEPSLEWYEIRRLKQYCYKCNLYDPIMDGCKDFLTPNRCEIALLKAKEDGVKL